MGRWTDRRSYVRSQGRMHGRMDGRMDRRSGGRTGGRADGRTDGRTGGRTDGQTDGWTGGPTGRPTGGPTEGRTDGRADGRTTVLYVLEFYLTFLPKSAIWAAWRSRGWIHDLPIGPTWDPRLYARRGLPRRPEDYSTRGPEDHKRGPEDLSIRLLYVT